MGRRGKLTWEIKIITFLEWVNLWTEGLMSCFTGWSWWICYCRWREPTRVPTEEIWLFWYSELFFNYVLIVPYLWCVVSWFLLVIVFRSMWSGSHLKIVYHKLRYIHCSYITWQIGGNSGQCVLSSSGFLWYVCQCIYMLKMLPTIMCKNNVGLFFGRHIYICSSCKCNCFV